MTLSIYRDRDAVEKTFQNGKSYLGFDVFRVHDTESGKQSVYIICSTNTKKRNISG